MSGMMRSGLATRMLGGQRAGRFGAAPTLVAMMLLVGIGAHAEAPVADAPAAGSAKELVVRMLAVEDVEAGRKGHYVYLSKERSERTGFRLWTERIAETSAGKLRRLIAEDGQPLTGDRAEAERQRLAGIAADPEGFRKRSEALKNDEKHAKQMLNLLPKAFLLEGMVPEGEYVRVNFRPDPGYAPQSMEERVLHGMVGTLLIDAKSSRLYRLEGRLPQDVTIGYGLLATIKAGSNFSTVRSPVPGNEWKTSMLDTDIMGKAIFFKAIGKKAHAEHSDFVQIPMETTVAQAVELVER